MIRRTTTKERSTHTKSNK